MEVAKIIEEYFIFGLVYQGKDIVFRFIIEYSSLRDFGHYVIIIGLFFIWGFLKDDDDILARVETWEIISYYRVI
jgi:hypothetical protein